MNTPDFFPHFPARQGTRGRAQAIQGLLTKLASARPDLKWEARPYAASRTEGVNIYACAGAPGPLLLAGSFIGSVAGWQGHLGLAPGWCGGLIGLALPALFTFIPSTILVLSFAEVAEEGVGDRPMHDAIGMVAAVAAGAVLSLGVGLVFRLENLILAVPVAAIAGGLSYRRALGAPALIGLGAAAGFFFVR
jgi:hypothetical protein